MKVNFYAALCSIAGVFVSGDTLQSQILSQLQVEDDYADFQQEHISPLDFAQSNAETTMSRAERAAAARAKMAKAAAKRKQDAAKRAEDAAKAKAKREAMAK